MSVYSRRFFSVLIVFVISLLYIFNSFASTAGSATPSDATQVKDKQFDIATSSNAMPSDDFLESDGFDTLDVPSLLAASGLPSVTNTVDYSAVSVGVEYYDMSNVRHMVWCKVGSDGWFNITRPSNFVKLYAVRIQVDKSGLPSPGKYKFEFVCNTQGGGASNPDRSTLGLQKAYTNASTVYVYPEVSTISNYSEFYVTGSIDLGVLNSLCLYTSYPSPGNTSFGFNFNGAVKIRFERLGSGASTDISSPGADSSSQDIQQGIADNTAQQVEQGGTIIELIKNTIQTISSQLTAFWNQLAGEFTNLYAKMTQQHSEQLQADRDNTDDIIAADDANTNKVTTAIESHGNFIIEGLKKLFIPSDEYFKAYFDDLYSWFSERFGFLSFPIDLLLEVIDIFVNSSQTDCVLVLPSFTIMDNLLWPEMSFNLTDFLDTNFSFVVVAIKTVTSIYLVMAFVQLCEEKWNEVMMN